MSGIAFIIIGIFSILKKYQTFFTVASSLYNAISSIQDFQYLHILTNTCFCSLFLVSFCGYEKVSHFGFSFHFSGIAQYMISFCEMSVQLFCPIKK